MTVTKRKEREDAQESIRHSTKERKYFNADGTSKGLELSQKERKEKTLKEQETLYRNQKGRDICKSVAQYQMKKEKERATCKSASLVP